MLNSLFERDVSCTLNKQPVKVLALLYFVSLTPSLRRPYIHAIFFDRLSDSVCTRIPFFESFAGSRVNTPLVAVTNVG